MKKIIALILVLTMMGTLMGCGAKETIGQLKDELKQDVVAEPTQEIALVEANDLEVPSIDEITIEETYQPVPTMATDANQITIALYYASADGKSLIATEQTIPKMEGLARETMETLLEGPTAESGLVSAIPAGTELLDINVKADEGLCIVDFSQDITTLGAGGVTEDVTVYAITNTLCQFPTITQVEFRVEGQAVTTLAGKMDLSQAVTANSSIIKQ